MISYLNEQPRTQALADALRGTAATSGGTQMQPRQSMVGASSSKIAPPDYNQYGGGGDNNGLDMLGKGFGKWAKGSSGNPFGDTNLGSAARSGWDSIGGLFGGAPSHSAATVRGGAPMAGGGGGWTDSISSMFGGGGGGSAGAGSSGGMMSAAGPIIGAVLGGLKVDDLLNESGKDKWYSADKLNDLGTFNIGGKDMGFRVGDFANGVNPATWLSDPKKGATGLLNAFTFGLFD